MHCNYSHSLDNVTVGGYHVARRHHTASLPQPVTNLIRNAHDYNTVRSFSEELVGRYSESIGG